ncbi:MauE/DoxX family redox-associated membrane protein [Nocardia sp.]|uniref:MauE/DoxX family redox-associated membrane protein n=1 Tax=Nocardia sp. TaxID=1821 RepID=UPI0026114BB6|nr:MauE/DoxX family redox-associated membrane protein [Nocardia sp.]
MTIEYGVWGLRLALGVVFGLSAAGKFADLSGTRKAVGEFGIPIRWVPAAAWALPVVEALVAVGLLPPWTAAAAALVAVGLLLVFTAAVALLLRRGKHPACSCFGAASSAPIGVRTLVRNAVLILLAAVAVVGALRYSRIPEVLPVDRAVGMAVVAVFTAVSIWLWGEVRVLRRRLDQQALSTLGAEGLPPGAVAPEFELLSVAGGRTSLAELLAPGRYLLMVFVHPGCEMCAALARELPRWQSRTRQALTIAVVGNGEVPAHEVWGREQGLGDIPVLVQQGNEAALRYRVRGTPSGVLITAEGRLAAPVARGAMAIRDLIQIAKHESGQAITSENGQTVSNTA